MKVLVTTIVALNPGDAAILQGTVALLRRAYGDDVQVAAVDARAHAAAPLYPWMRFVQSLFAPRRRGWIGRRIAAAGYEHRLARYDAWRLQLAGRLMRAGLSPLALLWASRHERNVLSEYLDADLVVASGGTYIVPAYDMEPPLRDYELTLALGRPFGMMPQSLGPFSSARLRERFLRVFRNAEFLLVRDRVSQEHLASLGVPERLVKVVPDAAFAMLKAPDARALRPAPKAGLRVAISVREWSHFKDPDRELASKRYFAGVAAFVEWVVDTHDAHVTFLSSCQGIPDYWTDDARTAQRVVEALRPDVAVKVEVDSRFRDPDALLAALAGFDLVVATRMHVAILALCAGRMVLPIAYEFKTEELFASLGFDWMVTRIDSVHERAFIDRAERVLREWSQLEEALGRAVTQLGDDLSLTVAELARHAASTPASGSVAPPESAVAASIQ